MHGIAFAARRYTGVGTWATAARCVRKWDWVVSFRQACVTAANRPVKFIDCQRMYGHPIYLSGNIHRSGALPRDLLPRRQLGIVGQKRRDGVSNPTATISGTILITTKGYAVDMTHKCSCVDVSPRGMGIDCPELLAVAAFIQVHSDERGPRRVARVRFCHQLGDMYRVGLQFVSPPQ
jgi:PilZ domain